MLKKGPWNCHEWRESISASLFRLLHLSIPQGHTALDLKRNPVEKRGVFVTSQKTSNFATGYSAPPSSTKTIAAVQRRQPDTMQAEKTTHCLKDHTAFELDHNFVDLQACHGGFLRKN